MLSKRSWQDSPFSSVSQAIHSPSPPPLPPHPRGGRATCTLHRASCARAGNTTAQDALALTLSAESTPSVPTAVKVRREKTEFMWRTAALEPRGVRRPRHKSKSFSAAVAVEGAPQPIINAGGGRSRVLRDAASATLRTDPHGTGGCEEARTQSISGGTHRREKPSIGRSHLSTQTRAVWFLYAFGVQSRQTAAAMATGFLFLRADPDVLVSSRSSGSRRVNPSGESGQIYDRCHSLKLRHWCEKGTRSTKAVTDLALPDGELRVSAECFFSRALCRARATRGRLPSLRVQQQQRASLNNEVVDVNPAMTQRLGTAAAQK
ncbi:hypothetical protein AAFF_G00385820 [Aldrovandia affinis]|uniref:Uncharacterized protein n=1 Tax=Aldrovandia affinis TaxID=143900 RepID=A0AAD7WLF6_9TELE|nr:hypothetical protein AAFF_G00385820 [Aldrovandia affinis]